LIGAKVDFVFYRLLAGNLPWLEPRIIVVWACSALDNQTVSTPATPILVGIGLDIARLLANLVVTHFMLSPISNDYARGYLLGMKITKIMA
jgi:hypothetical protein